MQVHTPDEIGELVRTRRHDVGLTQAALADRIGATRQWVNALESGRPRIELGLALRALAALGVTLNLRATDHPPVSGAGEARGMRTQDQGPTRAPTAFPGASGPLSNETKRPVVRPSLDAVLAAARGSRRPT